MKDTPEQVSPVAKQVIAKCGGVKAVARATGKAESTVYKWMYPRAQGGTGGLVPAEAQRDLMKARKKGLFPELTASDFFESA